MFEAKTYLSRRKRLCEKVDKGLILIMGNLESPMNYTDNTYPFRQDSNFLYFTGLDRPELAIIIDADSGETTLYGEDFTIEMIVWMGPQPTLKEMSEKSGIEKQESYQKLGEHLQKARSGNREIHFLPPYRAINQQFLSKNLNIPFDEVRENASKSLIKAVVALASVKSEEEITEMEKAVNITGAMHLAAMKRAQAGIKESEIAGIIEGIAISAGGRLAYPAIVTINGQTLHNHYHGNTLKKGQLVLGDFGAETSLHYAGDITRTFPVDKVFTTQQKEIYNVVLDAQLAALKDIKAGRKYLDTHLLSARKIAEGLNALGIMKGDTEEAVQQGAHALFFPHGLGHMIGLGVHDMEDLGEDYVGYTDELKRSDQFGLKSLRLAREVEEGFVLTVEPGVYFIPELIDLWRSEKKHEEFINYEKLDEYLDFGGIRIEDNIAVTKEGYRLLGDPIPKTVSEVEAVRNS